MRAARTGYAQHKTLRAQGDILHTFGPLLIPSAFILVGWGVYQLDRAIAHPLESDAASILAGSVALASGLLMTAFLLRSLRIARLRIRGQGQEVEEAAVRKAPHRTRLVRHHAALSQQPFPGHYVDDVRISR